MYQDRIPFHNVLDFSCNQITILIIFVFFCANICIQTRVLITFLNIDKFHRNFLSFDKPIIDNL